MADEKNLVLETNHELGEIVIAPEVIEVIIGIAASKVDGVYDEVFDDGYVLREIGYEIKL